MLHARSLAPLVKTRGFGMTPHGMSVGPELLPQVPACEHRGLPKRTSRPTREDVGAGPISHDLDVESFRFFHCLTECVIPSAAVFQAERGISRVSHHL
jgi:hypothetical protein